MSEIKIIGSALPDMPWQDKPSDCMAPVWRYSDNPIINRNPLLDVARIFNSAMEFRISILAGARTRYTGGLTTKRSLLPMKTASLSCHSMHTIRGL